MVRYRRDTPVRLSAMVAPAPGKPRRTPRRRRKGGKRSRTDVLNGILAVRLKDGTHRYRASIPAGRRGKKGWTPSVDTPERRLPSCAAACSRSSTPCRR